MLDHASGLPDHTKSVGVHGAGPGNHTFNLGPGADTIVEHRGRSQVWTSAGDGVDVRDGQGDHVAIGVLDGLLSAPGRARLHREQTDQSQTQLEEPNRQRGNQR
jgi:hypothetical protein